MSKESRKLTFSWNLAGLLAALTLLVLSGYSYYDYTADDAFISYRYARNLAEGNGLVWNPGEKLESYSNFLWVMILAVLHKFGLDIIVSAKYAGIFAGIALLIAAYRLARDVSGIDTESPIWLAPVLLAFNRDIIFWMPSGLETIFFALLLTAAGHRYLVEDRGPSRFPFSSLLFLLVACTRPEGILYYLATVVFDLLYHKRIRWSALLLVLGPFCIYHMWRIAYFGDFLPCPYYAKIGGDQRFLLGAGYVGRYLVKYLPAFACLSVLLLFPPRDVGRVLYLLWLMIAGTLAALWMDGDWMWHFRLMIPVTVLLSVLIVPAVGGLLKAASGVARRARAVVLLLGIIVLHQATGPSARELVRILTLNRQPMSGCLEGEMTVAMKTAGLWIKQHSTPRDLVAVNHAGALPYYADRIAIDMTGLCDRHISRVPGGRHEKYDPDYVLSRKPRYVVLNTSLPPEKGEYGRDYWDGETALYDHPQFQERYRRLPTYWRWRWDAITPNVTYTILFERIAPHQSGEKTSP